MGELANDLATTHPRPTVLVVGSCIEDSLFFVERTPNLGESLPARRSERRLGGKGFNQAVALARLGLNVTFVGAVGNDGPASQFRAFADKEGIDFRVETVNSVGTGVAALMVTPDGVSSIVVDPAASMRLSADHLNRALRRQPWDAVLCHYEVPASCLRVLFDGCAELDVCIVCNPAPWAGEEALEFAARADVVILNQVEGAQLAQAARVAPYGSLSDLALSCAKVCSGKVLVLTAGASGSVGVWQGTAISCGAIPVAAIDSTGAGDAFCGGLLYGLLRDWPAQRALAFASAAAAIACTQSGGSDSMPTLAAATSLASGHPLWRNAP